MWKKLTSIFMSVVLVAGLCPGLAFAEGGLQPAGVDLTTQGEGSATIESVRAAINALSDDATTYTADDKGKVEAIQADFESLSAEDQATLDKEQYTGGTSTQSCGRILESALWAVKTFDVDSSTTLADGTYTTSTTPAVSSVSNKGKSDSSRVRNWWVESVEVANGVATANIYVTGGAATAKKLTSYPSVWVGGQTISKTSSNTYAIPVDLNGVTYFGGISSSMKTPTMYALEVTIDEPAAPAEPETTELAVTNNIKMFKVGDKATLTSDNKLTITTTSTANSKAYPGSFAEANAAADEATAPLTEGSFTFAVPAADGAFYVCFFSAKNSVWYERKATIDRAAKTLVFDDSKADYAAVEAAQAKVPAEQGNFTDASWQALQEAVAAVVTGKPGSEQAEVDAMAQAIENAVAALEEAPAPVTLSDGVYALPELKAGPSAMFNHFIDSSKVLVVSGETATLKFMTDGSTASIQKYSKLFRGKSSDLESNYQPTDPEGVTVIDGVEVFDGTSKYAFSIPLTKAEAEALLSNDVDDDIYVTIWNKEGSSADKVPGWYKPSKDIYLSLGKLGDVVATQDVTFALTDAKTNAAVAGAAFEVVDAATGAAVTPTEGVYALAIGASYKVTATEAGHRTATETVTVNAGDSVKVLSAYPKNYYYWMQIRGAKPVSEQSYSIHGTGEVVKLKAESTGEEVVIEPPAEGETYYVLNNLTVGETYTVTVTAPQGYALVTNGENGEGEWSIPLHGYVRETDGSTVWTKTFTVTDEAEFLGNLIVNFREYNAGQAADFSRVDAALEQVPADMKLFVPETVAPVTAAVNAVNRNEADQGKVEMMASNILTALGGLVPKDGEYEVTITSSGSPYYFYNGSKQPKTPVQGKLVVSGGVMTYEAVVNGSSYALAFVGSKDDAIDAAPDETTAPAGAIELTANADNASNRDVVLPVSNLCTEINYAYHSSNSSRYTMKTGWYDQKLTFNAKGLKSLAQDDRSVELTPDNRIGMMKIVSASLEKGEDGSLSLVFALNGTGYRWMYKGTYPAAVLDKDEIVSKLEAGESTDKICVGYQNADEKWEFRVPLAEGETVIPIVSISARGFENRASTPIETAGFYARMLTIDYDAMTIVSEDYHETADYSVVSNVADFNVANVASTEVVGGPVNNNYSVSPTLVMSDGTYDKVTFPTVVSGKVSEASADLADGKFAISMTNAPKLHAFQDKQPIAMKFHVAADAPYAEAGTDVVRNVTIDQMARTITIEGAALTPKSAADPVDLSGAEVTLAWTSKTFTGKVQKPEVAKVEVGGQEISADDYAVEYSDESSKNAGSYTVTVVGKGNCVGTAKAVAYKIARASIASKAVALSWTKKAYNGKVQKPTVAKVNGKALKLGVDYTVKYSNAKSTKVGTYKVTVIGKGNYAGTAKVVTYKIAKVNPMTVKALSPSVKFNKAKAQKIAAAKAFKVAKAQGAVTYQKASGDKQIAVAANGTITVAKGAKKGKHVVKVNVTAAGNGAYASKTVKNVTLTVVVK